MLRISFAASTAALWACAPAQAQPQTQTRESVAVPTRDLDLERRAHVVRLDLRIGRAARTLCGTAPDYDLKGRNLAERCRRAAIRDAAPQRDGLVAQARGASATATAAR